MCFCCATDYCSKNLLTSCVLAVLTATSSRQSFMKHEQVLHARKCKYFWIYPKITFAFVMDYSEQIFRCMYAIDMILQITIQKSTLYIDVRFLCLECRNFWVTYRACSTLSRTRPICCFITEKMSHEMCAFFHKFGWRSIRN